MFWGILTALIVLWFFSYIRFYADNGFYGDQVHFLIMTQSIIEDDDLDVKNQYLNGSYWDFYIDPTYKPIDPHLPKYKFDENSPAWYPLHNPALSMYLVPAFWVMGAKGALYAMIALDLLVLVLLYFWILQISNSKTGAILGVAVMMSAPFFLSQIGYIFTDLPILALMLGSLLVFFKPGKKWWDYLLLSTLLGVGVWLHVKMILPMGTMGVLMLFEILNAKNDNNRAINLGAMILPAMVLVGLFEWKLNQWYGVWLPTSSFAGDQMLKVNPANSLSAYLFDRNQGLLTINPGFWLVFLGLPAWYAKKFHISNLKSQKNCKKNNVQDLFAGKQQLAKLAIILGPLFLVHLTFDDWCGGYSPAGRYMISFWPILLPAVGFVWEKMISVWLKILIGILAAWQTLYSFFMIYYRATWALCGARNNIFIAIENKTGWALDKFWPVFNGAVDLEEGKKLVSLGLLYLVIVGLLVVGWRLNRTHFKV